MNKVIFGINITDNKKNDQSDEQCLVTKKIEQWQEKEQDQVRKDGEEIHKKGKISKLLSFLKYVSKLYTIMFPIIVVSSILDDLTIELIYYRLPILFFLYPLFVALWIFIYVYEKKHNKQFYESAEVENLEKQAYKAILDVKEEFNIPEDAVEMDALGFRYKLKNGIVKVASTGLFTFINVNVYFYLKNKKLCIADLEHLIEINLSDFIAIKRINKNAMIPQWNKDVPPNKEPYKKFKMVINQMGLIYAKPYYIISFKVDEQIYDLYLPVYEINNFINLTGFDYADEYTNITKE